MPQVSAHIITHTITETVIDPSHAQRKESAAFRAAKRRLKQDGHFRCWVCGSTQRLQVHHRACEWMFEADVDFALLKAFCEEWDAYGYGRLLTAQPVTTVDDVRNQLVLCREHHIQKRTGIHEMTFPAWIMQKLAKANRDPVPQDGETASQVLAAESR